jgi:hypothetical protein
VPASVLPGGMPRHNCETSRAILNPSCDAVRISLLMVSARTAVIIHNPSMSDMGMLRQLTLRPYPKSHLCAVSPEINHLGTVCNCV